MMYSKCTYCMGVLTCSFSATGGKCSESSFTIMLVVFNIVQVSIKYRDSSKCHYRPGLARLNMYTKYKFKHKGRYMYMQICGIFNYPINASNNEIACTGNLHVHVHVHQSFDKF